MTARDPTRAEAWLTTLCRPLILLTLTGLVVARWFGWSSGTLSEAEVLKLWGAYEMALTAYAFGRSIEKIVPAVADALRRTPKEPAP